MAQSPGKGGGWFKRRQPVFVPLPLPGAISPLVVRNPIVFRQGRGRNGSFFKPAQIPAKVNIPGGVIRPWVVRRDQSRRGAFYGAPFLLIASPHTAGSVPPVFVRRWDFERAGKFYREGLLYKQAVVPPPSPALVDGSIWYAVNRGNVWDVLLRSLSWSADVATFLTKRTGETRLYAMDFSALPELQSANLSGVSSVTATPLTVGASNVTLNSPALGSNGKTAVVWISGGVSGASYQITFTVTVAGGTVLEDFGYLLVEDE